MELRVLRYFLTVAQEGSISGAAQTLHLTQPTLSRQLHDLEIELGVKLFNRGKREITLTEAGALFRERAAEVVALVDKTTREFVQIGGQVSGTIHVGCIESMGSALLARIIAAFHKRYPLVRFHLYNNFTDDLKWRLEQGLLDVGLLMEPTDIARFSFLRFPVEERWGVTVSVDDPLATRESVLASDLEKRALILPVREAVRREVLNWFQKEENELNIVCEEALFSNVMYLVEEGMGCAIGLEGVVGAVQNPYLAFVPFHPRKNTRSVLVWKKNRTESACVKLFLDFCASYIKENFV
ncbi:LysR family transcriptional regulator [Dubosiella muris]|uniref:LysR family transcriptional regulator n=2 Tax=Dubosiella TaxID=1937008 RepID=A0AC61R5S4_9FIRM|nr:LysR family transcriptional regulator [Dubosiella muris]TGY65306.1 LysR family transcriptional regulator [Dubosiella muris]